MLSSCCSYTKKQNIDEVERCLSFRDSLLTDNAVQGNLSIHLLSKKPFWDGFKHPLPYPIVICEPLYRGIPPGEYVLYCPHIGDPAHPECAIPINLNSEGFNVKKVVSTSLPPQMKPHIPLIRFLAIPGFTTDWYLISTDYKKVYHTTFVYEPILAKTDDGKSMVISKKEPGGNLMEISLNGFQSGDEITLIAECENYSKKLRVTANESGSSTYRYIPQIPGKSKGKILFKAISHKSLLEAEIDWDSSTLSIRKNQRDTPFKKVFPKR